MEVEYMFIMKDLEVATGYTMPELTEKPQKMSIPRVVVKGSGNKTENSVVLDDGYGFMYKGIPFFLQNSGGVWLYNIYGLTVGNPAMNTYTNHRKSATDFEHLDWIVEAVTRAYYINGVKVTSLEEAKAIFEILLKNPGINNRKLSALRSKWAESIKSGKIA